jgi:hypothetical protein
MLTLSEEQLAAIQDRIKASGAKVTRVNNISTEREAELRPVLAANGKKGAVAKKKIPRKKKAYVHRMRESQVMDAVQRILATHPKVAMFWRQNTGAAKLKGFYVKFSFKGAADWLGMLQGGRFLAVECKGTGCKASDDQIAFLKNVNDAGGFALVVDDPAQLIGALDAL